MTTKKTVHKFDDNDIANAIAAFAPYAKHLGSEARKLYRRFDQLELVNDDSTIKEQRQVTKRIAKLERMMDRIDRIQQSLPTGLANSI
jgi:hypothetical protein